MDGVTVARPWARSRARVQNPGDPGGQRRYYVFDVPVDGELDLKKAARAVGEKSVAMLHVAELLP